MRFHSGQVAILCVDTWYQQSDRCMAELREAVQVLSEEKVIVICLESNPLEWASPELVDLCNIESILDAEKSFVQSSVSSSSVHSTSETLQSSEEKLENGEFKESFRHGDRSSISMGRKLSIRPYYDRYVDLGWLADESNGWGLEAGPDAEATTRMQEEVRALISRLQNAGCTRSAAKREASFVS